jgi:putative ABC transport system ATP-binding protein
MARQVMDLLEQINGMGTTVVLVTHDPELARRAQRNVHVVDGQISDFKAYEPTGPAGQAGGPMGQPGGPMGQPNVTRIHA